MALLFVYFPVLEMNEGAMRVHSIMYFQTEVLRNRVQFYYVGQVLQRGGTATLER
jgi:hypothetical protein